MVSVCSRKSIDRGPDLEDDEGGGVEETCTVDEGEEEGGEEEDEDEEWEVEEAPVGDEGEGDDTAPPEDGAADMMTENERKEESGEKWDDGVGESARKVPN